MRWLRVGLCQINTVLGDFTNNTKKILSSINEAKALGVNLLTLPELAISGYPPGDLLLNPRFIEANQRSLQKVVDNSSNITIIIGFVDTKENKYNAAAIIHDGKIIDIYHKINLRNFGFFNERHYFKPGNNCSICIINGIEIGISISNDLLYQTEPAVFQTISGAKVLVNISASPYYLGERSFLEKTLQNQAINNKVIIAYNNLVGGQDEIVFGGNSMIFDEEGQLLIRGKQFEEDFVITDLEVEDTINTRYSDSKKKKTVHFSKENNIYATKIIISKTLSNNSKPKLPKRDFIIHNNIGELYNALLLGTRDYVHKNNFDGVVIGISGGVDSSLVATIATDALGHSNIIGVFMPSRYTSSNSSSDTYLLSSNLGIKLITISIENIFQAYLETLIEDFNEASPSITEENIQARIRGNILMALSNKFDRLVLSTSNNSELLTGYTTLYGDMAGGFAVLKDVTKTSVYELIRYRNSIANYSLIPTTIINKPPSAELRPNQKDSDTLPPYEILDNILNIYLEEDRNIEEITSKGIDIEMIRKTMLLFKKSEHKRRQAPPGIKIKYRSLYLDLRLPITNRFEEC